MKYYYFNIDLGRNQLPELVMQVVILCILHLIISGVSFSQSLVLSDHNQPESLNDSLHEDEWTLEARESLWHHIQNTVPDTVPNNVECIKVKRCDKRNVCAIVCQSGSVVVDPWLQQALKLQRKLAFHRDFCHAHVPGSHNSAINIADVRIIVRRWS